MIRSIVKKFVAARKDQVPKGIDSIRREELMEILHDYLQRYLIVFDDMWSINAWVSLKCGLSDNNCGSRIMVTTRIYDVASSCIETYGHFYKLQPLSAEEAWTHFCRKAFGTHDCCPIKDLHRGGTLLFQTKEHRVYYSHYYAQIVLQWFFC